MAYAMKDCSNLILVSKKTGKPALYIDYANSVNSEFSSEAVYANKKGNRAVRFDGSYTGTMTIETEMFDMKLLALNVGAEVKRGEKTIFERFAKEIDDTKKIVLPVKPTEFEPKSLSVFKLKGGLEGVQEDKELLNTTTQEDNIPDYVKAVTVSTTDTTATISFSRVKGADYYVVSRNDSVIGKITSDTIRDDGLTAGTEYSYTVQAVNQYGTSAKSPVVKATTNSTGVTTPSQFIPLEQAITEAKSGKKTPAEIPSTAITYTLAGNTITLNDNAQETDAFVVYYMEKVLDTEGFTVNDTVFPEDYEIYTDAIIRPENGEDEIVKINYFKAKPQPKFTLNQSASEPTKLSIVFDLFADKNHDLCEIVKVK
jgi:hypothetical protein